MGLLAALQANIHRAPEQKAFSPSDFMPDFRADRQQPDTEQTIQAFIQSLNEYG